jgi:hypothetical protein
MKFSTSFFHATLAILSTTVSACDFWALVPFDELPGETQVAAMDLGYTNDTWNSWKANPIEFIAFHDLIGDTDTFEPHTGDTFETPIGTYTKNQSSEEILGALAVLDLYDAEAESPGVCWDFFVNHYDGYSWAELGDHMNPFGDRLAALATALGWTEEMWDAETFDGAVPEAECKLWTELKPDERWALRKFGWFAKSWAQTECDPRCPKSDACPNN